MSRMVGDLVDVVLEIWLESSFQNKGRNEMKNYSIRPFFV